MPSEEPRASRVHHLLFADDRGPPGPRAEFHSGSSVPEVRVDLQGYGMVKDGGVSGSASGAIQTE